MKSNVSLMTSHMLVPQCKRLRSNRTSVQYNCGLRKHIITSAIPEAIARIVKLEEDAKHTATAILAIQQQQNSYVQVIDNKGEAYQVKFEKSLAQFSTELTKVITRLKEDLTEVISSSERGLKQKMSPNNKEFSKKLAEMRTSRYDRAFDFQWFPHLRPEFSGGLRPPQNLSVCNLGGMPTYQIFPKWVGKTPKTKKIGEMRKFQTFLACVSPFLSFFGLFWCCYPHSQSGKRRSYGVMDYRYWCPLTIGAVVHI